MGADDNFRIRERGKVISFGLDLSSFTGAVALSNDPPVNFSDELTAPANCKGFARLAWFRSRVLKLLATYPPALVVIEGYAFSGKFTNSFQYEIGSIVRMALHDAGIVWVDIPPTTLKSAVTGSGTSKKEKVLLEVYKKWGFDAPTNNIADAYVLAKIGQAILGVDVGFTKAGLASIFKVESVKDYVARKA